MSYDISVVDEHGDMIELPEKHDIIGGTYAIGGTTFATLNITYNYSDFYYKHIDKDNGIRAIYDKTLQEAIPMLDSAIEALGDEKPWTRDYWAPTAGNARAALENLREIARRCLEAYPDKKMFWDGD